MDNASRSMTSAINMTLQPELALPAEIILSSMQLQEYANITKFVGKGSFICPMELVLMSIRTVLHLIATAVSVQAVSKIYNSMREEYAVSQEIILIILSVFLSSRKIVYPIMRNLATASNASLELPNLIIIISENANLCPVDYDHMFQLFYLIIIQS